MADTNPLDNHVDDRIAKQVKNLRWQKIHLDPVLLLLLTLLSAAGLCILYSASNANNNLVLHQVYHLLFAFCAMILVAQCSPKTLQRLAPGFYFTTFILLLMVMLFGHISQGARRWLQVGSLQIQPSEFMKLAMPLMLAWLLENKPSPIDFKTLFQALAILLIPTAMVMKQPDLGTAILIGISGLYIIILAGVSRYVYITATIVMATIAPIGWHFLHSYQKLRILTLFNPQRDPLGAGYNIIQSKIAVGSGGFLGKGWLHGTQSHLAFLPTHTTDFIFAVSAEELGFIGCIIIIALFILITFRCLVIVTRAQNNFTRLLSGSLALTFLTSAIINMAMVVGLAPIVGVPLPLISYGGSAMATLLISFGIIMSIHTHRKLWSS